MWWFLLLLGLSGVAYVYWKNSSRAHSFKGMGFKVQHAPRVKEPDDPPEQNLPPRRLVEESSKDAAPKQPSFEAPAELPVQDSIPAAEASPQVSLRSLLRDAAQALDEDNENKAVDLFSQILVIDNTHSEANQRLGLIYLKRGMAAQAETLFKVLTEIETSNASHFSNLGYAFFMQNRLQEARQAYEDALALDSSRAGRFASLAQVYMSMKKYEEAVELLKKCVDMEPRNIDFWLLIADNYRNLSKRDEAARALETILELDPQHEEARVWLSSLA